MFSIVDFMKMKKNIKTKNLRIQITSDSMVPLINVNDIITIEHINSYEDLEVKDIIVYYDGKKNFICHLISEILYNDKRELITRGLNKSYNDPPIAYNLVLGRTTKIKD